MSRVRACARCLRRGWLLRRLAGHLDAARGEILATLELDEAELIDALGGRHRDALHAELSGFRVRPAREELTAGGVDAVCRCHPAYPSRLRDLDAPPAVLYVAGGLDRFLARADRDSVAVVGTRQASTYGREVARSLGRALAGAGLPVISGLALGVDAAAHRGALEQGGSFGVAVLGAGPDRAYPRSHDALYRRLLSEGCAISELPPGSEARRWTFTARNRLIAALASMTVVVEAGEGSGALLTAEVASALGRPVGAVPGRVTAPQAMGPNRLLAGGAGVIRGAQDVLDGLFGAGMRVTATDARPALSPGPERMLIALAGGASSEGAIAAAGLEPAAGLAAVAELELSGYVRRGAGGGLEVVP